MCKYLAKYMYELYMYMYMYMHIPSSAVLKRDSTLMYVFNEQTCACLFPMLLDCTCNEAKCLLNYMYMYIYVPLVLGA